MQIFFYGSILAHANILLILVFIFIFVFMAISKFKILGFCLHFRSEASLSYLEHPGIPPNSSWARRTSSPKTPWWFRRIFGIFSEKLLNWSISSQIERPGPAHGSPSAVTELTHSQNEPNSVDLGSTPTSRVLRVIASYSAWIPALWCSWGW